MVRIWRGALLLLSPLRLSAQAPPFNGGIDLVHVGITVVDRDGYFAAYKEADARDR